MKFIVAVREVHVQQVEVDAISTIDAKRKVQDGEGTVIDNALEYSHTVKQKHSR